LLLGVPGLPVARPPMVSREVSVTVIDAGDAVDATDEDSVSGSPSQSPEHTHNFAQTVNTTTLTLREGSGLPYSPSFFIPPELKHPNESDTSISPTQSSTFGSQPSSLSQHPNPLITQESSELISTESVHNTPSSVASNPAMLQTNSVFSEPFPTTTSVSETFFEQQGHIKHPSSEGEVSSLPTTIASELLNDETPSDFPNLSPVTQ